MSILVDSEILRAIDQRLIKIEPFDRSQLGTNSYDVRLAPVLRTYRMMPIGPCVCGNVGSCKAQTQGLDTRSPNETDEVVIPEEGYVLQPGTLYLASTVEYTETRQHVPMLNGKSSLGRLGLSIHVTAGFGDDGFCGHWTMEMFVIHPLRIYPRMKIAQLAYFTSSSTPDVSYDKKRDAKYNNTDPTPGASAYWRNFEKE